MTKLNPQGLARGDKGFMSSMVPPPGHVFVSVDLAAGEPSVSAHYSQDKNYYDACFGMVGKEPYYDGDLLRCDDIYIMTMSRSPIGKQKVKELFDNGINNVPFVEQWMLDKEVIQKKVLKKERALHKAMCLGLGYGMGAKKLVKQAYDAGEIVSLADAKAFFKVYWEIFSGMYVLGKRLEAQYKRQGYLVNDFGYRLIPREGYKCLNYFIQSSVSGLIAVLFQKFKYLCPWAQLVTIIHDEALYSVPIDRVDEAKTLMDRAMASVNEDLKWSIKIRNGWAVGDSLFTAK